MTYDEFVESRLATLSRYALMLTGDTHAAQDLVQETMVRAHNKWRHVSAADAPDRYVRAIMTNLFLDWRRGSWLRRVLLRADVDELPRPGDHAERSADRDLVWQALATLPRQQRAALVLRFYEDLPDQDIADALRCSVGTVRAYISRGLAALREQTQHDLRIGGQR